MISLGLDDHHALRPALAQSATLRAAGKHDPRVFPDHIGRVYVSEGPVVVSAGGECAL